ncbi:hypothetical protein BGZ50_001119, partial [Haplosporangium sp. Z 11]
MSVIVPTFKNACISPTRNGSSVYLIGVPVSAEGRLGVYTVDITDINTPIAKLLSDQADNSIRGTQGPRACFDSPGNQADPGSPTLVVQFGVMSSYTFVYPNGAITNPNYSEKSTYVSPKLFSLVAAFGPMTWYAAVQEKKSTTTGSNWTSVRFNASNPSTRES